MQASAVKAALTAAALTLGAGGALRAQAPEVAVPEPLRPWVPWVLAGHPDLPCPLVGETRQCAWPGRLELDLDERGGSFRLEVTADRELELPLPGDAARWPLAVTRDGRSALLRSDGDRPLAVLPAGRHRLAGRFRWERLPESLPVPPEIGIVSLRLDGQEVPQPRREESGLLWLAGRRAELEAERLTMEVSRRIRDGVPVLLTVRLKVRVSGRAREIDLGDPLPAPFVPISVTSDLPVRLAADGPDGAPRRLRLQVRPGEWQIAVEARSLGPVSEVGLAERPPPWPDEEFWVFEADTAVRTVKVEGAPGIDPQRTPLPPEWLSLPAYRLVPGGGLVFGDLRRGRVPPAPDFLQTRREWWLSEGGRRIVSRDSLRGGLSSGGRLEALEPAELGSVTMGGREQVITLGAQSARPGVEVRDEALALTAELVYPRRTSLPAVGWDRDGSALSIRLNLPPGWHLLAATGADRAAGSLADSWDLLDLFFLLLIGFAVWKLASRRWAALAFVVLGLSWHEPYGFFLVVWWLAFLALLALVRVLPDGRPARLAHGLRWLVGAAVALQLALFCLAQWRSGLFPQLELDYVGYQTGAPTGWPGFTFVQRVSGEGDALAQAGLAGPEPSGSFARYGAPSVQAERHARAPALDEKVPQALGYKGRARQVDAAAVVQTGPGVPRWSWHTYSLIWSGPVPPEQRVRLLLIPPGLERLLSGLRLLGLVLLGARLLDPRRHPRPGGSGDAGPPAEPAAAAVAAALMVLLVAAPARAQEPQEVAPPAGLLDELERRLTAQPLCHPGCVEVPALTLRADARGLSVEAEVHAAALTVWPVPGPADAWMPRRVTVDGRPSAALRRGGDGFLLLRLEPGTHLVALSGPARASLTLQMPLPPRTMEWRGEGWEIAGFRADAPPPASVRLDRLLPAAAEGAAAELAPWLELTRELDLGIPWLVHNRLARLGPSESSVVVSVPLIPGEAVTTGGIRVERGEAVVRLERGESERRWDSTLEETGSLTLTAPSDRPWLERWVLACSPIWSCAAEGLAPVRRMDEGVWRPQWRPWPGESLTLRMVRPAAVPGATTTIDSVRLELAPERRTRIGELGLRLRTSRGGEQVLTLPAAAELQYVTIDDDKQPLQLEDGRLVFTLQPGSHEVRLAWQETRGPGVFQRAPAIGLGGPAANVMIELEVPASRWPLWTGGPRWGSVVTLWLYLPFLIGGAWALGRWSASPLTGLDWLLLGVGLTQAPLALAAAVVLWLISLGVRGRPRPAGRWRRRLRRALLGALWLFALAGLFVAVREGLVGRPQMGLATVGLDEGSLSWYRDSVDGALPRPWVLWLPIWVFRVLMLAWALWLGSRLLHWLPWAWKRLVADRPPQDAQPA